MNRYLLLKKKNNNIIILLLWMHKTRWLIEKKGKRKGQKREAVRFSWVARGLTIFPRREKTKSGVSKEATAKVTERDERSDINSCVLSKESGTEGEGSDPLPPCSQRHSQLGRPSPPLLQRCMYAPPPLTFTISDFSNRKNIIKILTIWFSEFSCS